MLDELRGRLGGGKRREVTAACDAHQMPLTRVPATPDLPTNALQLCNFVPLRVHAQRLLKRGRRIAKSLADSSDSSLSSIVSVLSASTPRTKSLRPSFRFGLVHICASVETFSRKASWAAFKFHVPPRTRRLAAAYMQHTRLRRGRAYRAYADLRKSDYGDYIATGARIAAKWSKGREKDGLRLSGGRGSGAEGVELEFLGQGADTGVAASPWTPVAASTRILSRPFTPGIGIWDAGAGIFGVGVGALSFMCGPIGNTRAAVNNQEPNPARSAMRICDSGGYSTGLHCFKATLIALRFASTSLLDCGWMARVPARIPLPILQYTLHVRFWLGHVRCPLSSEALCLSHVPLLSIDPSHRSASSQLPLLTLLILRADIRIRSFYKAFLRQSRFFPRFCQLFDPNNVEKRLQKRFEKRPPETPKRPTLTAPISSSSSLLSAPPRSPSSNCVVNLRGGTVRFDESRNVALWIIRDIGENNHNEAGSYMPDTIASTLPPERVLLRDIELEATKGLPVANGTGSRGGSGRSELD
ncbi:hypothetical protein DFH06DRAFT_1119197 [Mycena polygramma]|nr:hypothetical protein DFH06DRAFT_1119197 [Mycena polygramma]